ncbi:MAG: enoyl-CoA hydratase [Herminiimonas sp.]|nr:enoyl-CoA hydratase [Herminiimonas sp.]
MIDDAVHYEARDGIAYIRLNRPHVHNALAPESVRALARIWQAYSLDRSVHVAILYGEGESFCSGRDMKVMDVGFGHRRITQTGDATGAGPEDEWSSLAAERRRINYVPPPNLYKPVIAAIRGPALGGGLELALNCDIRIAATGSQFGLPEVTRGVVPGSGGLYWLPRIIGVGPAMELLLTGRIIDASEALALRLVNRVVEPDRLIATAEEIAHQIARNPSLAVQAVKETVWRTVGSGLEEGLHVSEHQNRVLQLTQDAQEGALAFEEKRAPRYQGR